ncbi:MAG: DUF721 domain-containing protein [Sedimentisphaerales bacterium]|nr:DUF721 domain-containing protein [Sedimentisphaerales bacterium]
MDREEWREPCRMGDIAGGILAGLTPMYERCSTVAEAWNQVLPPGLRAHCRIGGFKGGCLRVVVDAASYMYELQLCKAELLKELQRLCPGTGLHRVQIGMARE